MEIKIKPEQLKPNLTANAITYSTPQIENFEKVVSRIKVCTLEGQRWKENISIEDQDFIDWDKTDREQFENIILGYLSFERLEAPESAPDNVTGSVLSDSENELSWDEVDYAEFYEVKRDDEDWVKVEDNEFTDSELESDTEYSYVVRASNSEGSGPASSSITLKTDSEI